MFRNRIPEIDVKELGRRLNSDDEFVVLDVREPDELERASINDDRIQLAPLSRLAREGTRALPASALDHDAPIYVMCHHGVRSAQVTGWLAAQGWKNVFSVRGGIDAYASQVDRSVGSY
ncbi:MAG: rhodanese-like domain-containing protein [Bacteroidota bacterium]